MKVEERKYITHTVYWGW